jgi:hypothetical protein
LPDLIENQIGGPWIGTDGIGGDITPHGTALVIRQTHRTHEEIEALLETLTEAATRALRTQPYPVRPAGYPFASEARVEKALEQQTELAFADTPLEVAMQVLADLHDIPILLDRRAFENDGIALDAPVNVVLSGISLRKGLEVLLDELGLTYVTKRGNLFVTSKSAALTNLSATVYDVRDLLIDDDADGLIDVLEYETSGPWMAIDGVGGTLAAMPPGLLVVRQTGAVHREIANVLSELRRVEAARTKPPEPDPAEVVVRFHPVPANADPRELAATIRKLVEPESWKEGDESLIDIAGKVLIIRQQRKVQERIARFLFELTVAAGTTAEAG